MATGLKTKLLNKNTFPQPCCSKRNDPLCKMCIAYSRYSNSYPFSLHHRLLLPCGPMKHISSAVRWRVKQKEGPLQASQSVHRMVAVQLQEESSTRLMSSLQKKKKGEQKAFSPAGSRGCQHIIEAPQAGCSYQRLKSS